MDTDASPVKFKTVRTISMIRSTRKMIAIQAGLRPTLSRIGMSIIIPAEGTEALPIEAKVAVNDSGLLRYSKVYHVKTEP